MCIVNLISAVAIDGSIGSDNKLLWKIKEDLDYYKSRTLGNVLIVGGNTFNSLSQVALRGRTHIVVSNNIKRFSREKLNEDILFSPNPQHALEVAKKIAKREDCGVFIIGGASIYKQLLNVCDFAFITWIDKKFEKKADTFFPIQDFFHKFDLISKSNYFISNDANKIKYKFSTYKKID